MNFYLSYGAGVGSEALRLWLIENHWPHEAVYVDHGCDWLETQEFVKVIPNLTIIKPDVQGYDNLYEYCYHKGQVPHPIVARWCTDKFKIRPLYKYFKRPCIVYIGYTVDESKRMSHSRDKEIHNQYPLISMGWSRQDAINYIASKNMPVPIRSNCWFCPFQTRSRWKELYKKHPDLYEKAKELEAMSPRGYTLAPSGEPLESIVQENQGELF
jgi:3'-phosphoadenosine 5'-phosphosulfate sulfotransferase (PAPS reductase)/FAD synthetase